MNGQRQKITEKATLGFANVGFSFLQPAVGSASRTDNLVLLLIFLFFLSFFYFSLSIPPIALQFQMKSCPEHNRRSGADSTSTHHASPAYPQKSQLRYASVRIGVEFISLGVNVAC